MKLLVAPELGHQFPPEWQKKIAEALSEYTAKGVNSYPPRIRFVTYTLKYPSCYWVHIEGLDRHYERASVDAERTDDGFKVQTSNVRILHLLLGPGASRQAVAVQIDGQRVEVQPYLPSSASPLLSLYLEHRGGRWHSVLPEKILTERLRKPQKRAGLQGPIDDAFTASFLCVRGTGAAWHEATDNYAQANLKRFRNEWSKYFRGELPIKDDVEVTPQDLSSRHLILFGDPASNSLIAQALPACRSPGQKTRSPGRQELRRRRACAGADLSQPVFDAALRRVELRAHVPRRGFPGHQRSALSSAGRLRHPEIGGR